MRYALTFAAVAFAVLAGSGLTIGPAHANDIKLENPWTRATPPGAAAGGGFAVITNTGSNADRLVGGKAEGVGRIEVHTMEMDGDVMKMREVEGGLEIPAGETVELKPGGLHVMFMGLKEPLVEGQSLDVVLTFENAGEVETTFAIAPVGAKSHGN